MIINIKTKLYFLSLSIFIVLIDQLTKYLMFYNNKLFNNKDLLLFKLDFVKNYGAAFNIFSGSRIFLSLISIFFSILLIYLIFKLIEQKIITKEVRPFKILARDTLFTYMSVVAGLFLLQQFAGKLTEDGQPVVYTNSPNF